MYEESHDSSDTTSIPVARGVSSERVQQINGTTPFLVPKNVVCSENTTHTICPTPFTLRTVSSDSSDSHDTQGSPRDVMNFNSSTLTRKSFKKLNGCSQVTPLPLLRGNLMTCHQRKKPIEYYQILDSLGVGSMGNVWRVRKRAEAIGGSARISRRSNQEAKAWKFLQSCFLFCPFARPNDGSHPQDFFQAISYDKEDSPLQKQGGLQAKVDKRNYDNHSKLISHGHKDLVFALKTINLGGTPSSDFISELKNEVEILKDLDHPNIVKLIETFDSYNHFSIVEELCDGGDLYSRDPYTEREAAKIAKAVFSAIAYMHSKNIIHRDIKYENILFTSKNKNADVKLIDFGLSKKYVSGRHLHDTVGTVYTMSPELIRGNYTSSADIWSMGVVSYMLLSSSMPFFGLEKNDFVQMIIRGKFSFLSYRWKFISNEAKKFISLLLKRRPEKRPTAEQALKNPWLDQDFDRQITSSVFLMDNLLAAIQTFADYTILKKLALLIVAYKSTAREIGYLRQFFDKFDILKNGIITSPMFKSTSKDYLYSNEELERIFMGMDIGGSGTVHYSEFLAATIEARGSIEEERLAEAFDLLDCDNSGYITVSDLRNFLGEDIPTAFLQQILVAVDTEHDHNVSYDEFLAMWDRKDDEKRIANQLKVKQRRIRRVSSKERAHPDIYNCGISKFIRQKLQADMVRRSLTHALMIHS